MSAPEPATTRIILHQPWRLGVALALTVGSLMLLWEVVAVLLLAFAGVLGAVLLCTCARFLQKWTKCSQRVGVTVMILVLFSGAVGLGWYMAPAIAQQAGELREQLLESAKSVERWINRNANSLPVENASEIGEQLTSQGMWTRLGGIFSTTFGALSALALVTFLAIFLAYDPERYLSGTLRLVPLARRQRVAEILGALTQTLSRWLVAQLISMVFLAISTYIVLTLLGVPLALVLALLTGVMTFVPYIGPLLAAIPIILVAFVDGPTLALWTAVSYLVVQNIESNVLMPLVYQRTVRLPPALTLTAQVLLGALLGLPGFMLATPLAAVALVIVRMRYVQDVLGDNLQRPVEELRVFADPPAPP